MSLINKFYAGKQEAIVAALLRGGAAQTLDDSKVVFAKAEWGSFGLEDLDLLMRATQDIFQGRYKTFEGAWEGGTIGDPSGNVDHFAAVMKRGVVEMFTRCDDEQIQRVAEDWGRRMLVADQQSKEEMPKGDQAARVEERIRWILGVGCLLAGAVMIPWALDRAGHPVIGWVVGTAELLLVITLWRIFSRPPRRRYQEAPTDPEQVSRGLRSQLGDLRRVCRVALDRGTPLIYYFSL